MQKVDRLGWTAGKSYVAFGVRFGIRSNNGEAFRRLEAVLPLGARPAASPVVESMYSVLWGGTDGGSRIRRFHIAYANDQLIARDFSFDKVLAMLQPEMQSYIAEYARTRIFIHAGVVEWRGRAIIIPAPTMHGKSTLVREFVRAGATFYSDEFAVIDRNGMVHPYPRPLTIRRDPAGNISESLTADTFGGRTGTKPIPAELVIFTRYRPGALWRPHPISHGRTVLSMLENSLSIRLRPQVVMKTLSSVASMSVAYESPRSDATEVVRWCMERLGQPDSKL